MAKDLKERNWEMHSRNKTERERQTDEQTDRQTEREREGGGRRGLWERKCTENESDRD